VVPVATRVGDAVLVSVEDEGVPCLDVGDKVFGTAGPRRRMVTGPRDETGETFRGETGGLGSSCCWSVSVTEGSVAVDRAVATSTSSLAVTDTSSCSCR